MTVTPSDSNQQRLDGGHLQSSEGQENLVLSSLDLGAEEHRYSDVGAFLHCGSPDHPTVRVGDMGDETSFRRECTQGY